MDVFFFFFENSDIDLGYTRNEHIYDIVLQTLTLNEKKRGNFWVETYQLLFFFSNFPYKKPLENHAY